MHKMNLYYGSYETFCFLEHIKVLYKAYKAFKPWKLGFDCFFSLMHYHLKKKKKL